LPFSSTIKVTDVNVGLLIISAMSAVGILGIILGGWASNSHYSLLGGLRSAAQLVSYEVALGLALMCGVMSAGTLSMLGIVKAQAERGIWFAFDNFGLMLVPFFVYLISAIAETNRSPFDLPEAENELGAGYHTEYSGMRFGLFFSGRVYHDGRARRPGRRLFLGRMAWPDPWMAQGYETTSCRIPPG
jgi:NADH-quinone oxidoreductase subunit H